MLFLKLMIIKLQPTDPERFGKEEVSRKDTWIFLGKENRINPAGRLRESRRGREQEISGGGRWREGHQPCYKTFHLQSDFSARCAEAMLAQNV